MLCRIRRTDIGRVPIVVTLYFNVPNSISRTWDFNWPDPRLIRGLWSHVCIVTHISKQIIMLGPVYNKWNCSICMLIVSLKTDLDLYVISISSMYQNKLKLVTISLKTSVVWGTWIRKAKNVCPTINRQRVLSLHFPTLDAIIFCSQLNCLEFLLLYGQSWTRMWNSQHRRWRVTNTNDYLNYFDTDICFTLRYVDVDLGELQETLSDCSLHEENNGRRYSSSVCGSSNDCVRYNPQTKILLSDG